MYKLFGLYTQVSCVRFSCLEEMFLLQRFFRNEKINGADKDQNQDAIGQSFHSQMRKEKVILNEYIGSMKGDEHFSARVEDF